MDNDDFFKKLAASPYKGCVSEVGIGVNFINELTLHPNASKSFFSGICPYTDLSIPVGDSIRKVGKDNVTRIAKVLEDTARHTHNEENPVEQYKPYGFAISGAHYKDRSSHVWMALATSQEDISLLHFNISEEYDRRACAELVTSAACWFLQGVLMPETNWTDHVSTLHEQVGMIDIDVLYADGVGDYERLQFLNEGTALVYHKGEFHRVVDYLRKYDSIFSGSFNPPHIVHAEIGEGTIFELSQNNCEKGYISMEDTMHRARMIDLMGFPVLITQAKTFLEKDALFKAYWYRPYTYRVGSDTWNRLIDPKYYDNENQFDALGESNFEIFVREGSPKETNTISENVNHADYKPVASGSSTEAREGNYDILSDEVKEYVTTRGLYK